MKSFLSAILMILSTRVLAQDSIPPFTELSKQVYQCLRHKDYGCLEKNMLSLDEMIKSLNALMKDYQKERDSVTTFDSNTLAPLLSHRNTQNIDAFYDWVCRFCLFVTCHHNWRMKRVPLLIVRWIVVWGSYDSTQRVGLYAGWELEFHLPGTAADWKQTAEVSTSSPTCCNTNVI